MVPAVVASPDGLIEAYYDKEAARRRVTASADGSRLPDGSSEPAPQPQLRRHGAADVARALPSLTLRGQPAAEVVDDRRLGLTAHMSVPRVTRTHMGMGDSRGSLPCDHGHEHVTVPRDAQVMRDREGTLNSYGKYHGSEARSTSKEPRWRGGAPHVPPLRIKRHP